jgi:acetylornithine deacetylase/succinyl-diaminopimelate desuccinylase-like protein
VPVQDLVVVPYLLSGATDSRNYQAAWGPDAPPAFRFAPLSASRAGKDMARIHGVDERVQVDDFARSLVFYVRVIELLTAPV